MTIPTEVAEHIAALKKYADETFGAAMVGVIANRLESALTKAEAVAVAWIRYRPDGLWDGPIHSSEFTEYHRKSGQWTPLYAHAPPAVPVESMGRDAEPAGGLDAAMRTNGLPAVSDALGYSRNFAAANPHLTQTTKDHITGLCDMLELASAHQTTPPTPPPASVPDGCPQGEVSCDDCGGREFGVYNKSAAVLFCHGCGQFTTLKPTNQEGAAPSTLAGFGPMPSVDLSGLTILDGEEEENHHGQ